MTRVVVEVAAHVAAGIAALALASVLVVLLAVAARVFRVRYAGNGATRVVLLVGRWAIKAPNYLYSWHSFVSGILANDAEGCAWRCASRATASDSLPRKSCLARVVLSGPLGLFVVMERCEVVSEADIADAVRAGRFDGMEPWMEYHASNYGRTRDGRVVLVDYGTSWSGNVYKFQEPDPWRAEPPC